MLALLHGASSLEARMLQVSDVDAQARTIRLASGLTLFHSTPPPGPCWSDA
jgi:hypothetical protein